MPELVIGFLMGAVVAIGGYWLGRKDTSGSGLNTFERVNPQMIKNVLKAPYGKPTGKTKPKINDDKAAWMKEREGE